MMPDDTPHFDDAGRLIAPKYADVYFSAEDGLAETRHVFLEGNQLAERFAVMKPGERFTIGETGFGTGLNFLAAWRLFEQHAPADARLEFVSVEGLALEHETMRRALSAWPELQRYRDALLTQWGPIWPGTHRFRFGNGRVRLVLLVGEAAGVLSSINASVDAWFLDGFAPSRNPAMWSDAVFAEVARLSAGGATLATYTAAGFVRRGLGAVGFEIEKLPGFGTKRDMVSGRYTQKVHRRYAPKRAVVIGGSIAGAFVARSLAERGAEVAVIERQRLVAGSLPSLTPRHAVLQPKISDAGDPTGRWLREGFGDAMRLIETEVDLQRKAYWNGCGSFQVAYDARSERRLRRFDEQFGHTGLCRWVEAGRTETQLGVKLAFGGLAIDSGGTLLPHGLVSALLNHPLITVRDAVEVKALHRDRDRWVTQVDGANQGAVSDLIVVANSLGALRIKQTRHLDIKPVRGQVANVHRFRSFEALYRLERPIFYGGYALPVIDRVQSIGASFVPGDDGIECRQGDHDAICDQLSRILPQAAAVLREHPWDAGWAGVRTTTPGHRCYAEQIDDGLYVSLGHGSHGIASAAHAGEHLASLITGGVRARATR